MFRVGMGFDVHRLVEGRPLWLGGVNIPWERGLLGHSDADVAIHALCDALLGAAALRDIGYHFPDTDPQYKGIDSKILLKKTCEIIRGAGYSISNVDSIICLQKPKIKDYIPQMQKVLAEVMSLDPDDVAVKATTTEHLGYTGREEGIACYANVLIYK